MNQCKIVYRHLRKSLFNCRSVTLEVLIATSVFLYAILIGGFIQTIITILYYIVILEVVRMVTEYIKSPVHRVKLRYLIDAAFVAVLREMIIIFVDSHHVEEHTFQLLVYSIASVLLLGLRYLSMKVSPSDFEEEYK